MFSTYEHLGKNIPARASIGSLRITHQIICIIKLFTSVQLLSCVWLLSTPWNAVCQASLSITNSRSLLKLMSIERWCHPNITSSVIPFSSCLQSFPASGSFPMSQVFTSGGQNIGASASALPRNNQDWLPLGLTSLIPLKSKGLSRVFSNTTVQKHQFFDTQFSLWSNSQSIQDYWKSDSFD